MNTLKVLYTHVSGKSVHAEVFDKDGHAFNLIRIELGHEKYAFYLEREDGDINITSLVSQELKTKMSTIAHEHRMKKTVNK